MEANGVYTNHVGTSNDFPQTPGDGFDIGFDCSMFSDVPPGNYFTNQLHAQNSIWDEPFSNDLATIEGAPEVPSHPQSVFSSPENPDTNANGHTPATVASNGYKETDAAQTENSNTVKDTREQGRQLEELAAARSAATASAAGVSSLNTPAPTTRSVAAVAHCLEGGQVCAWPPYLGPDGAARLKPLEPYEMQQAPHPKGTPIPSGENGCGVPKCLEQYTCYGGLKKEDFKMPSGTDPSPNLAPVPPHIQRQLLQHQRHLHQQQQQAHIAQSFQSVNQYYPQKIQHQMAPRSVPYQHYQQHQAPYGQHNQQPSHYPQYGQPVHQNVQQFQIQPQPNIEIHPEKFQQLQSYYANMAQQQPHQAGIATATLGNSAPARTQDVPPAAQRRAPQVLYSAEGYQSTETRTPNFESFETYPQLPGTKYQHYWNPHDLNQSKNWLDKGNLTAPHLKDVPYNEIILGLSSQEAIRAAMNSVFVRGASWAVHALLESIHKELRESGTMLGFKSSPKPDSGTVKAKVIKRFLDSTPPSLHGAQSANRVAWSWDQFYPGVFFQEGSDGKARTAEEIYHAWNDLRIRVVADQQTPILYEASTGTFALTDKQPVQAPVADVKIVATQAFAPLGQKPNFKMAQFPSASAQVNNNTAASRHGAAPTPEATTAQQCREVPIASVTPSASKKNQIKKKTEDLRKEEKTLIKDNGSGWTILASRDIPAIDFLPSDGSDNRSFTCSDGQPRVLTGSRLAAAEERTAREEELRKKQKKTNAEKPMNRTDASTVAIHKAAMEVAAGISSQQQSGTTGLSVSDDNSALNMATQNSASPAILRQTLLVEDKPRKKRRALDAESAPAGKRTRQQKYHTRDSAVQSGLRQPDSGEQMLFIPDGDGMNV